MANSTRKRSIKTKPPLRVRPKRDRKARATGNAISIGKYLLPAILISFFLTALGFFSLMGYRTVTASGFFEVRNVEVRGTSRASRDEISKIVGSTVTKTGAWNADLDDLRGRVEKVTFVKSATISRVLPNGIRVDVIERNPEAIVSLSSGDFLIDSDGEIITKARNEQMPAVIRGWDESKTEKAVKDNLQRFKLYQKMVSQWNEFDLLQRVREVNLGDLQDPHALIEDSGSRISVSLAKDNLGKSLKSAIEAVAGKGDKVRSVNASGVYPVIEYAGF